MGCKFRTPRSEKEKIRNVSERHCGSLFWLKPLILLTPLKLIRERAAGRFIITKLKVVHPFTGVHHLFVPLFPQQLRVMNPVNH
jgi:hypothetical protein